MAAPPPNGPPAGAAPAAPAAPAALAGPGAHETCPFCQASALVVPSRRLRYVCAVCGRARVPVDDAGAERGGGELEALDEATRAERSSQLWRGFGILVAFLGASTALVFLSFLVLVHPPLGAALLSGVFALAPSALAGWALRRSRQNAARVGPALERAWDSVAAEVLARRPSTTEAELASRLRLTPPQAEAMLVRLSAAGLVGSRLSDAGELTFHPTVRARLAAGLADEPLTASVGAPDAALTGSKAGPEAALAGSKADPEVALTSSKTGPEAALAGLPGDEGPSAELPALKARVATPPAGEAERDEPEAERVARERAAFEAREQAELEAALDEAEAERREAARRAP